MSPHVDRPLLLGLHGLTYNCRSRHIIRGLGLRLGTNSVNYLLNSSNYNGAAALHTVTNFRPIRRNRVRLNNRAVSDTNFALTPRGHQVNVIFRSCTLFPRLDITRGVTFNVHGRPRGSHIARRLLRLIGLGGLNGHFPRRLSNNRRRHITLTHTLTPRPRLLLLSRPFSGLSNRLHHGLDRRIHSVLGTHNADTVLIARSRRRTFTIDSRIKIFGRNQLRR